MQPEGFEHFSHFSFFVFLVKHISSEARYHPTALTRPLWILKEKSTKGVWDTPDPAGLGTQPCCVGHKRSLSGTAAAQTSKPCLQTQPTAASSPSTPAREPSALPLQTLTAVLLIRLVLAVLVAVTLPVEVDAFPIPALELVSRARVEGLGVVATLLHGLVGLVLAVGLVVTHPQLRDAHAVVALELVGVAGQRGALPFIAAIPAVVVTVTHEDDGDARLVTALELLGRTGLGTKANR